jgi:transketolase
MRDPNIQPRPFVDATTLRKTAAIIRATVVQMAADGREGHLKSALSCVDILVALYGGWLQVDPQAPRDPFRDRFLMSKGHGVTALYAVLAHRGFIEPQVLASYAHAHSPLPNHPCRHALPCLEISSGSLGHGLGMATGMRYAMDLAGNPARVAVLMSDGECNEGSVWESAAFACAQRQAGLVAIVDNNNMQAVGRNDVLLGHTSLEQKFRAFGWEAVTVDGNDPEAVGVALEATPFAIGKPSAIVARTVGGAGISFMADQMLWHYRIPSPEEVRQALDELGAAPLHKSRS